jgi:LAGLIDADG DNA endonuclease family/Cytochrome C oxidase subunit II, transmembrane domain
MHEFQLIFNNIYNDAAQPWQLGFQDSASPVFSGLVELHNKIGFFLIVISFSVFWVLFALNYYYNSSRNPIAYKYLTHGTILELVWTITPALILMAIAFPSFRLLYLMDNTQTDLPMVIASSVAILKITSNSTALEATGNIGSTLGIGYTQYCRNSTVFPKRIVSQLVGHLLGDGCLTMSHTSVTPYFVFVQSYKRFAYTIHVYQTLSHYCASLPRTGFSRGYMFLSILTRSYPYLSQLHKLFYVKVNGKYIKVITPELLPYLDTLALAYWAMDDGAAAGRTGFYLHTEGFTYQEVFLLIGMLHYQFGLCSTVQKHAGQPMIYITANSMPKFRALVAPHFHPTMMYKLLTKLSPL